VPDEVLLPRQPLADSGPYRRFFRAPVRFDQETAALVFPTRWLDHRIAGANPIFRQVFEAHIRELEAAGAGDWKENLRRVLRTEILTHRCSATTVADRFAIHRRTLSRHLQAEGAGFQSLVDETRFEIARQLLSQTRIPLSEVAVALGYSEASAFTRAFRRWSGQSPAVWRLEHGPAQTSHPAPGSQDRDGRQITTARARERP
jgi:AraC-like DNA-binding protein